MLRISTVSLFRVACCNESDLSEGEQAGEWVVVVKAGTTDAQIQSIELTQS